MAHGDSLILTLVAAFVLAFVLGMIAVRLRLPPIVGYLAAGVAVGPFTPGLVADAAPASQLAEIGVILLMFGVGLHFAPKDLLQVRRIAIPGALLQIGVGTGVGWAFGQIVGLPASEAMLMGFSLSVASTVLVLRTLEDCRQIKSEAGRVAVGWLVVQDLIVVVAMVLLPLAAAGHAIGSWASAGEIGLRLSMVALFIALMFVVGGRVLPWLLVRIAHTKSRELFTLGVLAIALGIAWLAYAAFGASFALGAFVAGLVLNGSSLGHNAAERALPLRDAFAVLFFVSVGMLFDPTILLRQPLALAGALGVVILAGSVPALLIGRLGNMDRVGTGLLAASLPQIGEFSFILAGLGVGLGVMTRATQSLVIGVAILSIALNPLLLWLTGRVAGEVRAAPGSPVDT